MKNVKSTCQSHEAVLAVGGLRCQPCKERASRGTVILLSSVGFAGRSIAIASTADARIVDGTFLAMMGGRVDVTDKRRRGESLCLLAYLSGLRQREPHTQFTLSCMRSFHI
jgi:hypothetical protein